jgi:glucose-1-phosphate cytidylyltransferase
MVEIGGRPISWHIMLQYAHFGFKDFVIVLGYIGEVLKKYILDYASMSGNLTVDLVDTGLDTMTGGRIKCLAPYKGDDAFMLTWGDGVSDVNLRDFLAIHQSQSGLANLTAVCPSARYGNLSLEVDRVVEFDEKPQIGEGWINGAFLVPEPEIFDYIDGDETHWEKEPLENLARDGQLMAYRHESFWQCLDTLREKHILETLWQNGNAHWKLWNGNI